MPSISHYWWLFVITNYPEACRMFWIYKQMSGDSWCQYKLTPDGIVLSRISAPCLSMFEKAFTLELLIVNSPLVYSWNSIMMYTGISIGNKSFDLTSHPPQLVITGYKPCLHTTDLLAYCAFDIIILILTAHLYVCVCVCVAHTHTHTHT